METKSEYAIQKINDGMLTPAAGLDVIKQVYQAKKEFINSILKSGVDYGTIPGSDKPALLKPGAEKMSSFFNLAPSFEDIETVEDWTGENHGGESFFYYRVRCNMYRGERRIASADGSCNSWEKKYRYRQSQRVCPECGLNTIIKGKKEYGGGWLCYKNKGGCGAKFADNDKAITSQETGQVKNTDIAEQVNTILKMAQKRALVAATLIATGTSEYFTQDIEDFSDKSWEPSGNHEPIIEAEIEAEIVAKPHWHDFDGLAVSDISLVAAILEKNSKGVLYVDLKTETLQNMAREMATILKTGKTKDGPVTIAKREEYQLKLSCIKAILIDRYNVDNPGAEA